MKTVGEIIREKNITLDTPDPVALHGFTQVPNFILKDPKISVGAKVVYSTFLSYAWHNDSCFPGQERLAEDMGLTRVRVTQLYVKKIPEIVRAVAEEITGAKGGKLVQQYQFAPIFGELYKPVPPNSK